MPTFSLYGLVATSSGMVKATTTVPLPLPLPLKPLFLKINLAFLGFFLIIYSTLLLPPSSSLYFQNAAILVKCSMRHCNHKVVKMKSVMEEAQFNHLPKTNMTKPPKVPSFMDKFRKGMKIGMINMEEEDTSQWKSLGQIIPIHFAPVSALFEWKHLFPEWIDEEEENDGPMCPDIPMPDYSAYGTVDVVIAKLPCSFPSQGWSREVLRLQTHLVAAKIAVKKGKRDWNGRTNIVLFSKCRPMLELYRCDDMVAREGDWWYYRSEMGRLAYKVSLPVGSCELALPLWGQGINQEYDNSKIQTPANTAKREAYVTVIHSSEAYVCGAITLAQSLLQTGTKRDLILLMDTSISGPKRKALAASGWNIRIIKRIRNPKANRNSYNEYNYSKFRLWQLTDYGKIIFIDSDIIVLRNLDLLFKFPQMSATGNDIWIFNSGIMVIEPSNCTFKILMDERKGIVSYNGGDQGFLNEIFVWWHRLPRRINYLKNFWANTSAEASVKNQLFGAKPAKLYSIHYLGLKPWLCYRDYDCNWDTTGSRVYASDVAHERWWEIHDSMDEKLQSCCALTKQRKNELNWERRKARLMGFSDQHWKINITDPRRKFLV